MTIFAVRMPERDARKGTAAKIYGELAQLVERQVRNLKVGSSSLLFSTKKRVQFGLFFLWKTAGGLKPWYSPSNIAGRLGSV